MVPCADFRTWLGGRFAINATEGAFIVIFFIVLGPPSYAIVPSDIRWYPAIAIGSLSFTVQAVERILLGKREIFFVPASVLKDRHQP